MADDTQLLGQIGTLIDQKLERVKKQLDTLQADVTSIKGDVTTLKDGQAHLTTAVDALKAGQDDLRADVLEIKAATLRNGVKLDKYQKQNERRFENLEEVTNTHNPNKN